MNQTNHWLYKENKQNILRNANTDNGVSCLSRLPDCVSRTGWLRYQVPIAIRTGLPGACVG